MKINKMEYVTSSDVMRTFIDKLHLLAKYPIDVLLYGKTGCGKDYFANYLHYTSAREGRFVAINCAAIPEGLAEAELFGVENGAYTGAQKRMGKIELANAGTLYLDEIDSMPINMQAKLLRALQERGAERVGSNKFITSQFCLIASSKIDLKILVEQDKFREDLYYRLNTAVLNLPSLRERPEEILALFDSHVKSFALEFQTPAPEISTTIKQSLLKHAWHGNVRELISCAQRFAIGLPLFNENINLNIDLNIKENIKKDVEDINIIENLEGLEGLESLEGLNLRQHLANIEKEIIRTTLERFKYSIKQSAAFLNLPSASLHYKMKQYDLIN